MPTYDDNNKVETKGKYIFIEDKNWIKTYTILLSEARKSGASAKRENLYRPNKVTLKHFRCTFSRSNPHPDIV